MILLATVSHSHIWSEFFIRCCCELEIETKVAEDYVKFYNYREGPY